MSAHDPQARALAAQQGFGELRAHYLPRIPGYIGVTITVVIATIVSVIGFAGGDDTTFIGVIAAIVAVIAALGLAQRLYTRSANADAALYLFDGGMIVIGKHARISAFRWEQMSVMQNITRHYRNGVYTGTTYRYTLNDGRGEPIVIGNAFAFPEQWGPMIQEAVTRAQLPTAVDAILRGETLRFGDIDINGGGLAVGRKSVTWSQIEKIEIKQGYVSVSVAGKWLSLTTKAVSQIPNVFVFLTLSERLQELGRR